MNRRRLLPLVASMLCACGQPPPPAEMRCGKSPETYFTISKPSDMAQYAGCTVLVGRMQQDSVWQLHDFSGLETVRRIEGKLNLFRADGFTSLKGLDNLESIEGAEGSLSIHSNANLTTLAGLERLRTVSGDLYISANRVLPRFEIDALLRHVTVGGTTTVDP